MEPPEVAVPADHETVRMTAVTGPLLRTGAGSVARYFFDLADWEACGWVVPHGVAADPTDPHFSGPARSLAPGPPAPDALRLGRDRGTRRPRRNPRRQASPDPKNLGAA